MNLAETESQHMQRAAGANQHRAEHGSARRGRRNALTDPRLVRSTGHVMALDFDPTVVGIASQPFWLSLAATRRARRFSHAPDFFARRADGSAVVVDCRPVERRRPRDVAKFEATRAGLRAGRAGSIGCSARPDPVVTANLRWLAGYRHPRHRPPRSAAAAAACVRDAGAVDGRRRGGG